MFGDTEAVVKMVATLFLRYAKAIKWFVVASIYFGLLVRFELYSLIIFAAVFIVVAIAFQLDTEREKHGMDDFLGGKLFFRYGELVSSPFISIPVGRDWSHEQTKAFADDLRKRLATRVQDRVPTNLVSIAATVEVTDQLSQERKTFMRMVARSQFGSTITKFFHFAPFGQSITAHMFTFDRGAQNVWRTILFFLESPLTVWYWGVPWLLNRYSILARVADFRASAFDSIDLRTMYSLSRDVALEELENLLREAGLLTEAIAQAIHIHMTNNQTINASGSAKVTAAPISQMATIAAAAKTA